MNAIKHLNTSTIAGTIIVPLHALDPEYPLNYGGKITIPCAHGVLFYKSEDIIYLKADSNYCTLYLTDGSRKLFSKTLKYISTFLPPRSFIRVHKSYVVNKDLIKEFRKENGSNTLLLDNQAIIPVSRSCKKMFPISSIGSI